MGEIFMPAGGGSVINWATLSSFQVSPSITLFFFSAKIKVPSESFCVRTCFSALCKFACLGIKLNVAASHLTEILNSDIALK